MGIARSCPTVHMACSDYFLYDIYTVHWIADLEQSDPLLLENSNVLNQPIKSASLVTRLSLETDPISLIQNVFQNRASFAHINRERKRLC